MPASRAHRWLVALMLSLAACGGTDAASSGESARAADGNADVDLTGAGATFPYPLYARWVNEYAQRTDVRINYLSVGSGDGIRRVLEGSADFGATESPMSDEELARSAVPIIHIPTVLGAVAITYNIPGLEQPLRLSGDVLADIFLGRVTRWNDDRMVALNPDSPLPARDVLVVHRADASGTSFIFSDYLAVVSAAWRAGPGRGRQVAWPAGVGGNGNEGVAAHVKQTEGSIGYVEVGYARQNRLPVAHVRNRAGRFISPMPFEIASAAASAANDSTGQADLRQSLVDAPGNQAYPITSFTWLLVSPQRMGPVKWQQFAGFLQWALGDGSDIASGLGYVALPTVTAARVLTIIDTLSATPDRRP